LQLEIPAFAGMTAGILFRTVMGVYRHLYMINLHGLQVKPGMIKAINQGFLYLVVCTLYGDFP